MKYTMIAYKDKDLEAFLPPVVLPMSLEDTEETLKQSVIKGQIPDAESKIAFYLGQFDTDTGKFITDNEPKEMFELSQYVRK